MLLIIFLFLALFPPAVVTPYVAGMMRHRYSDQHRPLRWLVPAAACIVTLIAGVFLGWLLLSGVFSQVGRGIVLGLNDTHYTGLTITNCTS